MKIFLKDGYMNWENQFGTYDCCSIGFLDRVHGNEKLATEIRAASWVLKNIHPTHQAYAYWDKDKHNWFDIKLGSTEDIEFFIIECRKNK